MSRTSIAFVAAAVLALGGGSLVAQNAVPELTFDGKVDVISTPNEITVGEVAGVGATSKGQIYVYTRTGHFYGTIGDNRTFFRGGSRLFQFDQTGKFVRELGQDVYGFNVAIGLRVDPQDNVWIIDAGSNQVVKFDPEGRVALVLGRKPEAIAVRPPQPAAPGGPTAGGPGGGGGGAGEGGGGGGGGGGQNRPQGPPGSGVPGSSFSRPTDVAWDKAGNIYIADGIGTTNRVAKYDKDGKFLKHWGSTGSGQGQFTGVRALAIDNAGNVYVADVGNKRVQVFDAEGTYKSEFSNVGTPVAMCITHSAPQHLYISHSADDTGMVDETIYKVQLDGKVVGKFGRAGKLPKEFGIANSIDCRNENELLVGEMTNWRVQKVTFKK